MGLRTVEQFLSACAMAGKFTIEVSACPTLRNTRNWALRPGTPQ